MPRLNGFLASSLRVVGSTTSIFSSSCKFSKLNRFNNRFYDSLQLNKRNKGALFSSIAPQLQTLENLPSDLQTWENLPCDLQTLENLPCDLPKGHFALGSHSCNLDISLANTIQNQISLGSQDAFYVVDLRSVSKRLELWKSKLPHVKPYYAVKCNPDPHILELLAQLGIGFDCASREEIDAVLKYGVSPLDIIYANPCKQLSHIQYAKEKNVTTMTFDSCDELLKVKQAHPHSNLILRLWVDDTHSQCPLASKFGAPLDQVPELLQCAKQLGLQVKGVSFHVGSGCLDTQAYSDAIIRARKAFDIAKTFGFQMEVLDIGGGFPGVESGPVSFQQITDTLVSALDQHFHPSTGVQIIAEPGRFFVASSHTLAVNVIGRKLVGRLSSTPPTSSPPKHNTNVHGSRHIHKSTPHYMYYVNDGVYGSFNCLLYDHAKVSPKALRSNNTQELSPSYTCSVWGPTCDGLDCISEDANLPILNIGEWMYFEDMGAYTSAAGSCFNGFQPPQKLYIS